MSGREESRRPSGGKSGWRPKSLDVWRECDGKGDRQSVRVRRMAREFRIMPATVELLPELLELERTCFSPPWTSKMWEAELIGNPFAHVLVAVTSDPMRPGGGSLIGFHCFWIVFEELRLMKLAVRESMRRRGVGRILVAEAIGMGMTRGSSRAVLEVRNSNEAAQRLYRELGFVSIGVRRGYYSEPAEDAVVMEMDPLAAPAGLQPSRERRGSGESVSAHVHER